MSTTPSFPRQSIHVTGLCDDPSAKPLHGLQFAVRDPGDPTASPEVDGDQTWVASGYCTQSGAWPGGEILVRDVTVTYGPWRVHIPATEPYTADRDTHYTGCPYRHDNNLSLDHCDCHPGTLASKAGRYWDAEIRPGLVASGVPEDVLPRIRDKYVRDALANPDAVEQLKAWAGEVSR